jgi:hypothetical protein
MFAYRQSIGLQPQTLDSAYGDASFDKNEVENQIRP